MAITGGITSEWLFKNPNSLISPTAGGQVSISIIGSREGATSSKLYCDGILSQTTTNNDTGTLSNILICRGAQGLTNSTQGSYAGVTEQLSFFGSKLTVTDINKLVARVNTFFAAVGKV